MNKERKKEILKFQRVMGWHDDDKMDLIKKLLKKIYKLEDLIENKL